MIVRLGHLYPREMNIYADRGNIAVLDRRLAWRGHRLEVHEVGPGEAVPTGLDLFYLGGGQDRDQVVVAVDLQAKRDAIAASVDAGAAFLAVCGGYQLAGHEYEAVDGSLLPGLGLLDLTTRAGDTRLIGDLVIEAELDGVRRSVVGYENHAGRTHLGPSCRPLGSVRHGYGNNGADGAEGGVAGRVVGTYLHGPLLPKNPWIADTVLAWALGCAVDDLEPIDDSLEIAAHDAAIGRAGVKR